MIFFYLFINDWLVFFVYNSGTHGHCQDLSLNLPTGPIQSISRNVCDMCVFPWAPPPITPDRRGMETSSQRGQSLNS